MPFRYVQIKDTKNGSDGDACAFNCHILAEGVQGVECIAVRVPTHREDCEHREFIPWGCHFSVVEVYANGAQNYFVRDHTEKVVGYLLRRPL